MIKTVIFDWDGTIHNTMHLYGMAVREALEWVKTRNYKLPERDDDERISQYLGVNPVDMWNDYIPEISEDDRHYAENIVSKKEAEVISAGGATLYDGALEMLTRVRKMGLNTAFLSNCKRSYMNSHRAAFDLDKYFTKMYCCEDYDFIPKEDIFPYIANDLPGEYIMVGDRLSDLKVAYTHGLYSIGCAYGFGSREELKDAMLIAESVTDIPGLVAKLMRR